VSDEIDRLLKFDPLDAAERALGRDNPDSMELGFMLHVDHNRRKREALEKLGDTTFSNTVERYRAIITLMGFELALELPFVARGYDASDPDREERYFIYAHRDGLLLCFDTYNGRMVNGASVYYNWIPHSTTDRWGYTSSGRFEGYVDRSNPGVWCGDHDAREALRHKIQGLRSAGELLPRWRHRPWMWLLHHQDTKDPNYDHKAITESRIRMCPKWVQDMIGE
jgi:hypothetical protein